MLKIYKASAGSGKTYTLVKEYLRLAFASPAKYRHILAITFTNKAAAEMKGRVLEALEGISANHQKYDALAADLCRETGKKEEVLRTEALMILRSMLHNYSDISISTIDSFVHRVVRAFAYDLHLPMSFDIEMDSAKLLSEAVDLLLDRLNESDTQVTQAVVDFAESKIEEGGSWNIEYEIRKLGRELFVDDALPHINKLNFISFDDMRTARGSLYAFVASFEKKLFDEGAKGFDVIVKQGLTSKDLFQGNSGIFGFFSKYASKQFPANPKGNSYVIKSVYEDKWTTSKDAGTIAAVQSVSGNLAAHFKRIIEIWDNQGRDYYLAKLLLKNFYAFILLADLQKLMEEIKQNDSVLYIGDFQHKVFEIVKEQEAPVIYERIGDKYDNILIDEFQDTSVIQWRNLLPLVENAQFKNEDSLIVGDAKQAIYRFRGGEFEQFTVLPKIYGSNEDVILMEREVAIHNYGAQVKALEKNFRSRKEIVDFNNAFYKEMLDLPELVNREVYIDYFQQQGRNADGGFVSIEFLKGDEEGDNSIADYRNARVEQIINDVLQRGFQLKDIAVLTRSNENASTIAAYLVQKGIKVVSPESLLINNSPKVHLLLSVFQYLSRKDDHIARAEVMHYAHLLLNIPLRYETLNLSATAVEFEQQLNEKTGLTFNSAALHVSRLGDLAQQLVSIFRLQDDDPFLQFFADEILLYSSRYGNNLHDFLVWWDGVKHKKSIIYPDSMNAVRIMTIHKSKGLQFPVVIMADAAEKKKLTKKFFWVGLDKPWLPAMNVGILPVEKTVQETDFAALYAKEDAQSFLDMLNLVYVGTTRAEEALYILSAELDKEPAENNSVTALLIAFLKRLDKWDGYKPYLFGQQDFSKFLKVEKAAGENAYQKEVTQSRNILASAIKVKLHADLLWSEETTSHIDKGKLLHRALQRIRYAGDEERVVKQLLAEGIIAGDMQAELTDSLNAIIYHTELAAYYSKGTYVINERPILKSGEEIRIPDRIVMQPGGAVIIDYKTGKARAEYKTQLRDYAKLLEGAGIKVSRKIIFYTAEKRTEEVV